MRRRKLAALALAPIVVPALGLTLQPALAAGAQADPLPPMKTIGQMAVAGDVDTELAEGIPRDFPVPASSRDLEASNAIPFASVSGGPELAAEFYGIVLPAMGWSINKKLQLPGLVSIVACKAGQCVNIGSGHGNASDKPTQIDFQFFPKQ